MSLGITISIVIATLLLFVLILSLYARHLAERDTKVLSELATKYGGKVLVNSFDTSASMSFPYRGSTMKFHQSKGLSGKATRCYFQCDAQFSSPLSMHIARGVSGDADIAELRHLVSMPRASAGSEDFNKEFVVRGNNKNFLNVLLNGEFEKQLLTLSPGEPVIYMHPKGEGKNGTNRVHLVQLSVSQSSHRKEELESLIDDGLALIRRLLGANAVRS